MACCTSRGDGEEQGSPFSFFGGLWETGTSSSSRKNASPVQSPAEDATFSSSRSEEVVGRHVAALPGKGHLLAYNVVQQTGSSRRPLAQQIPCNFRHSVPMENDNFSGKVCLIYRPVEGFDRGHPYYDHFSTRKRNWEFRLQGKFKTLPRGELFVGAVLRDFDYDQSVAAASKIAMNTAMSLIKYQYKIHFSWGARCKEAFKPNAELGCAVSDWTVFDQIIVTPSGRPGPVLSEDLDEVSEPHMSIMRRDLGLAEYGRMCQEVLTGINTEDTYTFRLWGLSQLLDVLGWQLKIGARVSLDHFMKDFPIHICMYDIAGANGSSEVHHLESQKRYFFDLMGWSNKITISRDLSQRYMFQNAPAGLVEDGDDEDYNFTGLPSDHSFHSCDGVTPQNSDVPQYFWRSWVDKLRK